jgi:hypothetical protein
MTQKKPKSNLTDEEKEIFIQNQSKIPRDKEAIFKIKNRYFKVKELG